MALQVLIDSVDRTNLLLARTLRVSLRSDRRNTCQFRLKTTAAGFLPNVGTDLQIMDGAELLYGGVIKTAPQHRPGAGTGSDTLIFVDVTSDGYHSIPARRTVSLWYADTTAGAIVTTLVNNFLTDEGISAGTINAGATIAAYDSLAKSVKDALDDMAEASGYKWYIDDAKALHFVQEDAVTAAAHDIVAGGAFKDYRDVRVKENLENYRNKQFVRGATGDTGEAILVVRELAAEIAARQAIEGGSGVYGNVCEDSNITTEADAEAVAENLLKRYGKVPIELTFNSDATDWRAGTKLKANLPAHGLATDTYFLIEDVTIVDLGAGRLRSYIEATRRDDVDFSTQRTEDYIDYFGRLVRGARAGGLAGTAAVVLGVEGDIAVGTNSMFFKAPFPMTVIEVLVGLLVAPAGAAAVFDMNLNGTTMYTTQANRPAIAAGETSGTAGAPDVASIAKGDVIALDTDQIGSATAGNGLMWTIIGQRV